MSVFTGQLTVTQLSGDDAEGVDAWRYWRLEQPLIYDVGELGSGKQIWVPAGFVTDGPSIPQFLWAILPVWGAWSRAGVVHDFLCCMIARGDPHPEAINRTAADSVFNEAMKALGVPVLPRLLLYFGVRIGTWFNVRTTMVDHNAKLAGILHNVAGAFDSHLMGEHQ